ncbi:hypothetical protein ACYOEI_08150 [Singulisphaera rosea]
MTESISPGRLTRRSSPLAGLRVWHLSLLVLFVAIAIVNIQDQRQSEPALIGLASAGFVLYGLIGWGAWRLVRRVGVRWGATSRLVVYLAGMAGFFLVSTYIYIAMEYWYINGHW